MSLVNFRAPWAATKSQNARGEDDLLCAGTYYYGRLPKLPKSVIERMLLTAQGRALRARAADWKVEPEDLFRGEPVQLLQSPDRFFVVMPYPVHDPTDFWLVQESHEHAKILLRVNAGCVQVGPTNRRGQRDIITTYYPPRGTFGPGRTETYRYDGKAYKLFRRKTIPESPPNDSTY